MATALISAAAAMIIFFMWLLFRRPAIDPPCQKHAGRRMVPGAMLPAAMPVGGLVWHGKRQPLRFLATEHLLGGRQTLPYLLANKVLACRSQHQVDRR